MAALSALWSLIPDRHLGRWVGDVWAANDGVSMRCLLRGRSRPGPPARSPLPWYRRPATVNDVYKIGEYAVGVWIAVRLL